MQGVGFRFFCMTYAEEYRITGSVENLDNGDVDIYMQGEEEDLNEFFKKIIKGDRYIRVMDYDFEEVRPDLSERKFTYKW